MSVDKKHGFLLGAQLVVALGYDLDMGLKDQTDTALEEALNILREPSVDKDGNFDPVLEARSQYAISLIEGERARREKG